MSTSKAKIDVLVRRRDFLAEKKYKSSYDLAEESALTWAISVLVNFVFEPFEGPKRSKCEMCLSGIMHTLCAGAS